MLVVAPGRNVPIFRFSVEFASTPSFHLRISTRARPSIAISAKLFHSDAQLCFQSIHHQLFSTASFFRRMLFHELPDRRSFHVRVYFPTYRCSRHYRKGSYLIDNSSTTARLSITLQKTTRDASLRDGAIDPSTGQNTAAQ